MIISGKFGNSDKQGDFLIKSKLRKLNCDSGFVDEYVSNYELCNIGDVMMIVLCDVIEYIMLYID